MSEEKNNHIRTIKAAINYLLDSWGYQNYYDEIDPFETFTLLGLNELDENIKVLDHVLDNYIYSFYKIINDLFFEYMINKYKNNKDNEFFISSLQNLIIHANDNKIPIIRFPAYIMGSDYRGSYCDPDKRDPCKIIIRFVDLINPDLKEEKYSEYLYFINTLAHELGHATDLPLDFSKCDDDKNYMYDREISAWKIAKNILLKFNLYNVEFERQARNALRRYYVEFFGKEPAQPDILFTI